MVLSLSLPELLLLALASPLCRVECQECGRLFFMLALLPLLSSGTTSSVVTVLLLLKVVLYLAWGLPLSPWEGFSLDLTLPWFVLRENINMVTSHFVSLKELTSPFGQRSGTHEVRGHKAARDKTSWTSRLR